MAKRSYGARHMAWVRSFRRKGNRSHHRKHYRKRNAYPMAGTVAALNPRRRKHYRKHNPGIGSIMRGGLGLPPVMTFIWGGAGFIATAAVQGFIDTLVPTTWKTTTSGAPNLITKYAEIAASIVLVTWGAKQFINRGAASFMSVGGAVYAAQQAAHDFFPNVIPGMHSYTPLKAYTPLHPGARSGVMGGSIPSAGGGFPQLATRATLPGLAAPDHGQTNNANFADDGGMNLVPARFRRFA